MINVIDVVLYWLNRISTTILNVITRWLLFPSILAVAGGVGIWTIAHPTLLKALLENRVPQTGRISALTFILVSFVCICLVYGGYIAWFKRRKHEWPDHVALTPLHRLFSAVFILPLCATIAAPKIIRTDPIFVDFLIIAAAIASFPVFTELSYIISRGWKKNGANIKNHRLWSSRVKSAIEVCAGDCGLCILCTL